MASDEAGRLPSAEIAELYDQHASELRAFLLGVLRNSEAAHEALQATFVKAAERGHTAHAETVKGWLFRVGFHEAMAIRRRDKIRKESLNKLSPSKWNPQESPVEQVLRNEAVEVVRDALEKLSDDQRQVVHMRIYEGRKFAEIADELGLPLGTVLTRMRSALKKLHETLRAHE